MRKSLLIVVTAMFLVFSSAHPVQAAVTWSSTSPNDSFNRPELNPQYDLTYVDSAIFDNDIDLIYFYLNFRNVPRVNQFNDGTSFAAIFLDYNLDGVTDYKIYLADRTLTTDRSTVDGYTYKVSDNSFPSCEVKIFTNIDEGKNGLGLKFLGRVSACRAFFPCRGIQIL